MLLNPTPKPTRITQVATKPKTNTPAGTLVFSNNVLTELPLGASYVTATPTFFTTVASVNDTTTSVSQINWINAFPTLGTTPDCRLDSTSLVATGADFTNSKFVGGFVSVNEITKTTNVSIYPNPATNNVNITTDRLVQVTLIDGMGRVISTQIVSGNLSLDVSALNNGIYFYKSNRRTTSLDFQSILLFHHTLGFYIFFQFSS